MLFEGNISVPPVLGSVIYTLTQTIKIATREGFLRKNIVALFFSFKTVLYTHIPNTYDIFSINLNHSRMNISSIYINYRFLHVQ